MVKKTAIIFGGTGFLGVSFAKYLLDKNYVSGVELIDLESVDEKKSIYRSKIFSSHNIKFRYGDVRKAIPIFSDLEEVSLIVNFAAIHREPGHRPHEYFETNILGAQNICDFAERIHCKNLIFSSSISPYGSSKTMKDESSLPLPSTPYGSSKLVAEKIHETWQAKDLENRTLTIIRPGVVFGPTEGGNVTRLIRSVLRGYFFYIGNRSVRKAGIYVKELCRATLWIHEWQLSNGNRSKVVNLTMNPSPTLEEYVETIFSVSGKHRKILNVPWWLLYALSKVIDWFAMLAHIPHPFSPTRIKKLVSDNRIHPRELVEMGYRFNYNLHSAFTDWKQELPEDWK
jgi:nucleoside-diphosphate-sugar epimerase